MFPYLIVELVCPSMWALGCGTVIPGRWGALILWKRDSAVESETQLSLRMQV